MRALVSMQTQPLVQWIREAQDTKKLEELHPSEGNRYFKLARRAHIKETNLKRGSGDFS